jgi:5'-nucleotidase
MTTLSRRTFLKGVVALGGGAVLYRYSNGGYRILFADSNAGPETYQLRIIHTNDHHARIEPATALNLGKTPDNKDALRNLGGVARRKTMFDQIRADATVQDKLFLDAGDVFQGTLYYNLFKGAADLFFYNQLGYHAVGVGNHEFDDGDKALADFIAGASFPMLSANIAAVAPSPLAALLVSGDDTANAKLGQRKIITMPSGQKIGIFGLTTPETPLLASPSAQVSFGSDLVAIAQAQVDALKAAGVNKVIALTHIGYTVDVELAKKVKGIDVIVGGHSHTPLLPDAQQSAPVGIKRVAAYPTIETNPDGNKVVITTDWEWAKWVGDIVVGFDAAGLVTSVGSATLVRPVWADGIAPAGRALLSGEETEITPDSAFQNKINTDYKPAITTLQTKVIGKTDVKLNGDRADVRSKETNLGNFIADAQRNRILREADFNPQNLPVVSIVNGGGVRASIAAGDVTVGKVLEVLPFGNTLATVIVTGDLLRKALENGVSQVESGAGRFTQVGGIRFKWDPKATPAAQSFGEQVSAADRTAPSEKGARIVEVQVAERSGANDVYKPLVATQKYLAVVNNFILTGGDGFSIFTPAGGGTNQLDTGLLMADVVMDAITAQSPLNVQTDGRISEVTPTALDEEAEPAVPSKIFAPFVTR